MDTKILKSKTAPTEIRNHQGLISEAHKQGAVKAQIILTKNIPLGNWVKLQCQYGCEFYGKRFTCPPCSPTSDEMSEVLMDYQKAIIIQMDDSDKVLEAILNLEESLKKQGYHKAFGICALPCNLCEVCTIDTNCQHPEKARPTFQACGMDVPQILARLGWNSEKTIMPCTDSHPMGMVLIH